MPFFQDLGKKISDATQDAAKKTSELIEISKLNSAINTEKTAITELQKKIGVAVYSLFTSGEQVPEALSADVQGIAAHLQKITELEHKIAEIKAESENAKQAEAAAAADGRFCSSCGATLQPGMLFCSKCGAKNG